MKRITVWRRLDPGWIVALALCLVVAWPFLSRPGLPRETDAELHVFRVAELIHLVRQGELYPRWASDFFYGYGYPLFNFYGPLTYYLGAAFAALPGVDVVGGAKAVFVLAIALSALGMYVFARDRWGALGGALSAVAYVFAPYLLLFDPYLRGNLAECFALGIIPWLLWTLGRLVAGGGRRYFVGVAVGWAALLTTHNVMAALLSALLLLYAAFEWLVRRQRRVLAVGALALALGLGLSAFYWLPVLAERPYIQNENIVRGYFDFHGHLVSPAELFGPAAIQDLGATFPDFGFNIGLGQVILVGLAMLLLFYKFIRDTGKHRPAQVGQRQLLFWLAVALGLVFLMLPVSVTWWEAIPPLAFVQFPWKLLGPLAVVVAVLVGALPGLVQQRWGERAALAVTIGGLLVVWLTALPNTFPPTWEADFGGATLLDHQRFERQGRAVGTTSAAEYLPVWVEDTPGPSAWLTDAYEQGRPLNKLDPASLPEGAHVLEFAHTPTSDRFVIESPRPFTAQVLTFYFPGWRAWLDGEAARIAPGERHGFITVELPAGTHTLEVRFGSTPPRTVGAILSLLSLLVLVGARHVAPLQGCVAPETQHAAPLLVLALILFAVKVGVIDRQPGWFRITSTGLEAQPAQHKLQANFSDQVMLLGYDLPQTEVLADGEIPLTLYWKAIQPVPTNYSVFVHLVRPPEHLWGQDDRLNPADFPMTRWPLDKYVRDRHTLPVLPGTPPGEYEILVGFYRQDTGERLVVLGADGIAGEVRLPTTVRLLPPRTPPDVASLGIGQRTDEPLADGLILLGWSLNRPGFTPPDFAHLTLFWQAGQEIAGDLTFTVALLNGAGERVNVLRGPVDGLYLTSEWREGEIVRDQYAFWLDESLPAGRYRLQLTVGQRTLWLAEFDVLGEKG
ncbi:MAG: 6-pyruvoyl-tetrahydropterin synthase-related protein [Chloroflexota bacterium]